MISSSRLVSFLLLLLASNKVQASDDCPDGEKLAFARIYFEDNTSQASTSWSLICDGATIWDVPAGSLSGDELLIEESTCVSSSVDLCEFTITAPGDLTSYPFYTLLWDSTFVARNDYHVFTQNTHCFGASCPAPDNDDCDYVYVRIQLDEHPQENSFQVECDGTTVMEETQFTDTDAFAVVEREECIATNVCCKFTLLDSGNDGLKMSPMSGLYGAVYLEWAYDKILEYDGSVGTEFTVLSVNFGQACA